jgi:hypothetical protein
MFRPKTRADEVETGDAAVFERAEEVLFNDLPEIAGPLHPEPIEDVQSIADLVATGTNELESLCLTEPGGEPRGRGLRSKNLNWTRWDQRTHADAWRHRSGQPAEVALGEGCDERCARISS